MSLTILTLAPESICLRGVTVRKAWPRSLFLRCQPDAACAGYGGEWRRWLAARRDNVFRKNMRKDLAGGRSHRRYASHCLCNCRQHRKLDRHMVFGPTDPQHSGLAVHSPTIQGFGCAQTIPFANSNTIACHSALRFRSRDRTHDLCTSLPGKQRGGLHLSDIACNHLVGSSAVKSSSYAQKSEKPSERTAGIRDGFVSKDGWQASAQKHPHLSISLSALVSFHCALLEEATRGPRHLAQRPFSRDPM